MEDIEEICPLCQRRLAPPYNKHHLQPLSYKGKGTPTVTMHKICHDKIHAVFTEKELAKNYNTIEQLMTNDDIQKFVKWIKRKPPGFYDRSAKKKTR